MPNRKELLPIEYPLDVIMKVYAKRLLWFAIVVVGNLALFGLIWWLSLSSLWVVIVVIVALAITAIITAFAIYSSLTVQRREIISRRFIIFISMIIIILTFVYVVISAALTRP